MKKEALSLNDITRVLSGIGATTGVGSAVGAAGGALDPNSTALEGAGKGAIMGAGAGTALTATATPIAKLMKMLKGKIKFPSASIKGKTLDSGDLLESSLGLGSAVAGAAGGGRLADSLTDEKGASAVVAYNKGFIEKCAQYGINPEALVNSFQKN